VSCKGEGTWAAFGAAIVERLSVPKCWEEVPTAALSAPAARPPNCLFKHRMLAMHGLDVMPDWRVALAEYLSEAKP
jgi:dTDP-4-dehydrorhamnose reductase